MKIITLFFLLLLAPIFSSWAQDRQLPIEMYLIGPGTEKIVLNWPYQIVWNQENYVLDPSMTEEHLKVKIKIPANYEISDVEKVKEGNDYFQIINLDSTFTKKQIKILGKNQKILSQGPFILNLKPSGQYIQLDSSCQEDIHNFLKKNGANYFLNYSCRKLVDGKIEVTYQGVIEQDLVKKSSTFENLMAVEQSIEIGPLIVPALTRSTPLKVSATKLGLITSQTSRRKRDGDFSGLSVTASHQLRKDLFDLRAKAILGLLSSNKKVTKFAEDKTYFFNGRLTLPTIGVNKKNISLNPSFDANLEFYHFSNSGQLALFYPALIASLRLSTDTQFNFGFSPYANYEKFSYLGLDVDQSFGSFFFSLNYKYLSLFKKDDRYLIQNWMAEIGLFL